MKAKKQDIILQELFREKLENAVVKPEPSVRSKLMRKQSRREFLRFNPVRFNAYYLGVILVAGLSAALIFSPVSDKVNIDSASKISGDSSKIIVTEKSVLPEKTTVNKQTDSKNGKIGEVIRKKSEIKKQSVIPVEAIQLNTIKESDSVAHTDNVNNSISKSRLLTNPLAEKNKLQKSIKSATVLFEPSAISGCAPLKLSFKIKSADIDSCRWTFGDGGSSIAKNPEWIFDVEGEYSVVLKAFGSDGSETTSTSVINVFPRPLARFEIEPENAVLPKDEIRFANYSSNATHFNWNFGDGNTSDLFEPRHIYEKFGNYTVNLVITSDHGCSDTLSVKNAFSGSEYFINFPNAFIPSTLGPTGGYYSAKSDEGAQVFHPVYSGVSEYQLKIFSKLGILIFESRDVKTGWDGYIKGQLCDPGVYVWKVRGSFRNGEPFIKMGDLTLLRN